MHPELHLLEPEPREYLTHPGMTRDDFNFKVSAHHEPEDESGEAADDEEDVPEPEDEVHLVDDDVEAEDAEGVLLVDSP